MLSAAQIAAAILLRPRYARRRACPPPTSPKIDGPAVRTLGRFRDPDSSRQQTRVADDQSLSSIENRQKVTETAKTIREEPSHYRLVVAICKPHCNHVIALAEDSSIHF